MPAPFGSFPFDASGIDNFAHPQLLGPNKRPPTINDIQNPGTTWLDQSVNPAVIWETVGAGIWNQSGGGNASTSSFGTVKIATLSQLQNGNAPAGAIVPLSNDVATVIAGIIVGAVPPATTLQQGIVFLATNAQAQAGLLSDNHAINPASLASALANSASLPIGSGGAGTGAFTTLGATTVTFTAGGTWASGGTAIQIGQDASADNISIGVGAALRAITVGNSTSTTSIALNTGTGSSLNLGTNAIAHIVTIGNITGATAVNVNTGTAGTTFTTTNGIFSLLTGTGTISLGADAADHVINIGNSTGATPVSINAGTSGVNIGTNAIAHTVTIGNITTSTGVAINVGTTGFTLDGVISSPYVIGPSTTTGAITIGGTAQTTGVITLGSSSATSTVKIASGAGASTVTIGEGTAGANTVSIINGAIAAVGTVNILSGAGAAGAAGSALHMANNSRVATIDLGNVAPSAARVTIINGGASAVNDTVSILNGAQSAGTQTLNIISGITTTTTAVQAVNVFGGAGSSSSQTFSVLNGANTNTTNTINLAGAGATGTLVTTNINTGAAAHVLNVGSTSAGNMTFTQASGSTFAIIGTAGTINIGTDAAANTVKVGSLTTTATTTIQGGTNGILLNTAVTGIITAGLATMTGTITLGQSTAGQNINIGSGVNTLTNLIGIANGAIASGTTTVNILNGNAAGGTLAFNVFGSVAATTAGTINLGTGAVAAASHVINIGNVLGQLNVSARTQITLASGAATGLAVDTSAGTGIAATFKSVNATTDTIQLLAGSGGIKTAPTVVAAGASPLTANNRFFQVTFSGVSIAAGATQSFTINNSVIAGASTVVWITSYGCTSGAGNAIQSVTPAAGSVAIVMTNPAAITTNVANLTLVGWVMS